MSIDMEAWEERLIKRAEDDVIRYSLKLPSEAYITSSAILYVAPSYKAWETISKKDQDRLIAAYRKAFNDRKAITGARRKTRRQRRKTRKTNRR